MKTQIPAVRWSMKNDAPVRTDGKFVLYWMVAFRRAHWNFSLDRAIEWARELGKPLLVLEALRCDYPWASERMHAFVLDGMKDNGHSFANSPIHYYPYVEREKSEGKGLLSALVAEACVVVTDDHPDFFLTRMVSAVAESLSVRLEAVDSNGLLPLRATDKVFTQVHSFRKFLQEKLPEELERTPHANPLEELSLPTLEALPEGILERWPKASEEMLLPGSEALSGLPFARTVGTVQTRGGSEAALERLSLFLRNDLSRYHLDRSHPDEDAGSRLSSYLHAGHISTHQVFSQLASDEDWSVESVSARASGKREGWWGMSEGAEAFLDQLVSWREIGFNMCSMREDYDRFESLPAWALDELLRHQPDPRPYLYSLEEFEGAATHDPVWNAAQRQLLEEGAIHNYLRMLWGKKILEWSASPREALRIMIELNNKYALDGRDPNSYSGIFWVLGRYDRPFGPPRPVFGKIRYMSSQNTLRKLRVAEYLHRYGA